MGTAYALTTEVFCLPCHGRHIIYAPLKGVALLVNATAANVVAQLAAGTLDTVGPDRLAVVSLLMDMGVVNGPPDEVHEDEEGEFRPTETTLFVTTACNLRCVYCYAAGGERPRTLEWPIARAAVDLVARNAAAAGKAAFGVSFHVGGEPTLAWELLQQTVTYAAEVAARAGVRSHVALATNGVLDREKAVWLTEHVHEVNLSVDGLGAAHDRLRPLTGGGGSFTQVLATAQELAARGKPFGLRMTVTRDNLAELPAAVEALARDVRPHTIHVEPVFRCGRCLTGAVAGPEPAQFVQAFRAARERIRRMPVQLYYSGARFPAVSALFCQAAGRNFTVTTDGQVTACYEVVSSADPRASTFFFGAYDRVRGEFRFDEQRPAGLRGLTVHGLAFCRKCFCKYHCAGDCPAKRLSTFAGGQPDQASERCYIAQELTRDQLSESLQRGNGLVRLLRREQEMATSG